MAIDSTDTVDSIGIDPTSDEVLLTISDHLDWKGDDKEHMLLLQEKVNSYLRFIESGEIYRKYPQAKGKAFVINIMGKFSPNEYANLFLKKIETLLHEAGYKLRFEQILTN